MATYHICDLCGKDLKDEMEDIYCIQIGPKTAIRESFNEKIEQINYSKRPCKNKEVCKECAHAYCRSLDEAERQRDIHEKVLVVGSIDYNVYNGNKNDITIVNGTAFGLGNYNIK